MYPCCNALHRRGVSWGRRSEASTFEDCDGYRGGVQNNPSRCSSLRVGELRRRSRFSSERVDPNGNSLKLREIVLLRIRLGDAVYRVKFIIADHMAVDVLVGTCFLNRHVLSIKCEAQQVRPLGSTIPILDTGQGP